MELYLPSPMCLYGVRKDSFTSKYYEIFFLLVYLTFLEKKTLPLLLF